MAGSIHERDEQWNLLLSRAYGEVEANGGFRASLLEKLKTKQAEMRAAEESETVGEETAGILDNDEIWSRFLAKTYPSCEAGEQFRSNLLGRLKEKVQTGADLVEDPALQTILNKAYVPVEPRREFQTRLLVNLKERQKTTIMIKENYRKRSIFSSFASGLAAAAAVLFVVWLSPIGNLTRKDVPTSQQAGVVYSDIEASAIADHANRPAGESGSVSNPIQGDLATHQTSLTQNAAATFASYDVDAAFASSGLPKTVRGIGMEINDGGGWRAMDESIVTRVSPGMAFRSTQKTAGLGFSDGSTVLMMPDAIISAAEGGFVVDQGQLAVTVPGGSERRFHISLPERDIAIEPGTMLAVNAFFPEEYAQGGAPAPEVKILDGGLAMARGKNGVAPLFANQAYLIDSYVTPDIPGRPLCAAECAELEDFYDDPASLRPSYEPSRLVSNSTIASSSGSSAPNGYFKSGTKWVANSYADQPATRIKYLSNEYFGLANERRDLASSLTLGSEVVIDAGDGVFYEIHR